MKRIKFYILKLISLLGLLAGLFAYTWFLPQAAFYDCVRVAPKTSEVAAENSAETVDDEPLSAEDWIRLFRVDKSVFCVKWFFSR